MIHQPVFSILVSVLLCGRLTIGQRITQQDDCPGALRRKCFCGIIDTKIYVTNCTNTGFQNPNVLKLVPEHTEILIFTGNNFSALHSNLFRKGRSYDKLTTIDLSNNGIRSISDRAFSNVKNVERLILNHNRLGIQFTDFHPRLLSRLQSLEHLELKNAFGEAVKDRNFMEDLGMILKDANLYTLKTLDLESNGIKDFNDPSFFCTVGNLTRLKLGKNFLMSVRLNFTCTHDMRLVDVSDNYITSLDNESMAYLDGTNPLFHINMTLNPFRCDCRLEKFVHWFRHSKVWVIEQKRLACASGYPESIIGRSLKSLSRADLQCDPAMSSGGEGYLTVSYIILICLIISLAVLVVILVVSNRAAVHKGCLNLWTRIHSKREYTSLQKESKRTENGEVDEISV